MGRRRALRRRPRNQPADVAGRGRAHHNHGETGVTDNDYPWFKIRYRGNRQGYQWGGIICSLDAPIDGTFETCP